MIRRIFGIPVSKFELDEDGELALSHEYWFQFDIDGEDERLTIRLQAAFGGQVRIGHTFPLIKQITAERVKIQSRCILIVECQSRSDYAQLMKIIEEELKRKAAQPIAVENEASE